jgi:hypothetical protein
MTRDDEIERAWDARNTGVDERTLVQIGQRHIG